MGLTLSLFLQVLDIIRESTSPWRSTSALDGAEIDRRALAGGKIAQAAEERSGRAAVRSWAACATCLTPATVIILSGSVARVWQSTGTSAICI